MMKFNKYYLLAAAGGALPLVVQYISQILSLRKIVYPDVYIVFLIVIFMLFGVLVYFVTHKSKEITALLGGIAAPGLIFALSTGNSIGEDGRLYSEYQHAIDLSIVSAAKASDFGKYGADVGAFGASVFSDSRFEKMPICTTPQVDDKGYRIQEPVLGDDFRYLSASLIPEDRDSLVWGHLSNLQLVLHTKLGDDLHSCVAPAAGASANIYGNGYLFAIELLGGKNRVAYSTDKQDTIKFYGRYQASVNFAEGLC